jgi:hypothetical protein
MLLNKPSELLTRHQLQYTGCCKNGLEALRGYSTNLKEKNVSVFVYPEISVC